MMKELNAKVGMERDGKIVEKFILGSRNECGGKCFQWCTVNDQIVNKTWFQDHPKFACGYGESQVETRRTISTK